MCSIGSANLDIRSVSIDYELNAVTYHAPFIGGKPDLGSRETVSRLTGPANIKKANRPTHPDSKKSLDRRLAEDYVGSRKPVAMSSNDVRRGNSFFSTCLALMKAPRLTQLTRFQ